MKRRWWRSCANCGEEPAPGCLCWPCLRAAVVPLVLAELIRRVLP